MQLKVSSVILTIAVIPIFSYATLGGNTDSILVDASVIKAGEAKSATAKGKKTNNQIANNLQISKPVGKNYAIYTITTSDGGIIQEYVTIPKTNNLNTARESSTGEVFAISWSKKKSYPNFKQLLGSNSAQLKTAAKTRNTSLNTYRVVGEDFIFYQSGLPWHLSGAACIPSKMPAAELLATLHCQVSDNSGTSDNPSFQRGN